LHSNVSVQLWLQAAEDARLRIIEHEKKIRIPKEAEQTFKEYAKEGHQRPQPQKQDHGFCAEK